MKTSSLNKKRKRKERISNPFENAAASFPQFHHHHHHLQHVDPHIISLFLQVIESQQTLIVMEQTMIMSSNPSSPSFSSSSSNIIIRMEESQNNHLWNRIQAQTEAIHLKPLQEQQHDYESNLERFLQEVSSKSYTSSYTSLFKKRMTSHDDENDNEYTSISGHEKPNANTMACYHFIMDILCTTITTITKTCIQDTEKNTIFKHAVLRVLISILQHDQTLESIFIRHIKRFVDAIGNVVAPNTTTTNNNNTNSSMHGIKCTILQMQQDAVRFMKYMVDKYTTRTMDHPQQHHNASKLIIAYRYLTEQKGISLLVDSNSTTMVTKPWMTSLIPQTHGERMDVRHLRDEAIQYGEKECRKIHQVLKIVHECIDILVPRFGHDETWNVLDVPSSFKSVGDGECHSTKDDDPQDEHDNGICNGNVKEQQGEDDDDDDDDDIEWEEGDDIPNQDNRLYDHITSVEQTLAVMQQSGSIQHDGIHVALDTQHFTAHVNDKETRVSDETFIQGTKEKLMKCATVLKKRLQVLDGWRHALVTADNMMDSSKLKTDMSRNGSSSGGSSLILLPPSLREKKGKVLHLIHGTKVNVTRALSAISRLKDMDDETSKDMEYGSIQSDPTIRAHSDNGKKTSIHSWIGGWKSSRPVESVKDRVESNWRMNQKSKRKPKSRVQIKLRRT